MSSWGFFLLKILLQSFRGMCVLICLEKEMATHSNILARRIPGTGEPRGLLSMGSHRVGHDWSDLAAKPLYWVTASPGILEHSSSLRVVISLSLLPTRTLSLHQSELIPRAEKSFLKHYELFLYHLHYLKIFALTFSYSWTRPATKWVFSAPRP